MNFQTLRNSFVVGSLGVGFTGFIALFTPYQQFSQFLIASGLGSLASSSLAIQQSEKLSRRKSKKFLTEIETLKLDTEHFSKRLTEQFQELTRLADDRNNLANLNVNLLGTVEKLNLELAATKAALQDTRDINIDSGVTTLRESLQEAVKQVNALVPFLVKKYPDVKTNCQELLNQFNEDVKLMSAQIGVISDNNSLSNEDLISSCLAVQHEIILKGSSIKAKLYKSACDHLQRQLYNVIPLEDHTAKLEAVKAYFGGNIKAIQNEFSQVADNVVTAYKADFAETVQEGMQQVNIISDLQNEVINLQGKLQELSKPLQLVGTSEAARVGNSIINYYHLKLGITLDGLDFNSTETGYKLLFHLSRNNRFIDTATLNDGNNPDKIKELSGSLNNPKFTQSERGNYVSLEIELRKVEKKQTNRDDVNAIWITKDKFEGYVKKWERVRITAGSTGGKSPTAKNLALAIMNSRQGQGEIKLYDPQDGSKKDFWRMPKAGTSHDDSVKGMKELTTVLDARSSNPGKHKFTLYLFDEIDSTLAKYKGDVKFKDLVVYAISQGSHQDLGMIFVGQSCDANTVPGMTHSHWNNCVQLHIGSNAGLWLDKSVTVTTEDKTRLLNQYRKIQEFCDSENDRLGLDIYSDASAYRFALAVPLTGLPKFIQLPDFDSYNYYEVMGDSESDVTCIHCTSSNVKRNGKQGDKQRYKCSNCGKNFTV